MHPFTAISIAIATTPHLWQVVHASPASTKSQPFPSVEDMESCQNTCLGKYPASDLEAQYNCNRECLHDPVSLLPPNPQSGLLNRGMTAGSPPEKFDYPVCVQTCEASDHAKANCTNVCQRLLPCWMYCNHESENDSVKNQHCLRTCVEDLKDTTSSGLFDATPNTADLEQAFSGTLLAGRDTANACSEDTEGHVICADQPKKMVPRNDRDQCNMDCDEIQHAHQTYLCKMNCTDMYSIGDLPPNIHARNTNIDTAEQSTVIRPEYDNNCTDYCNANSRGGSADEIHDRCSKACKTLEVCEIACEAQGPNDGERCVVDCIMIRSDAKDDSAVVPRDVVPQLQSLAKRYSPESCRWACHEIDDPTNQICYQPCIEAGPHSSVNDAADFVSRNIISRLDSKESIVSTHHLDKRYSPESCRWSCHEIDDPTGQICYQPCIEAGPHEKDASVEAAAVAISQDVKRRKIDDMPNHQGINISSPILTAEDLDRCTQGCVEYAKADSYPAPEKPCSHICMGVQACQSRCASFEDHDINIQCGVDCFMTVCQSNSIDCSCLTSKGDMFGNSSAECRIMPPTVTDVRAVRDVHPDPKGNDGFDGIEGASRLREMSLLRRGDQYYDGSSTTLTLGDIPLPTTTITSTGLTTTTSGWIPLGTMIIAEAAGSSLGFQSWQLVWVALVAGLAGGVFLW